MKKREIDVRRRMWPPKLFLKTVYRLNPITCVFSWISSDSSFFGDVGNFLIGSCAIRKSSMPVTTAENGRVAMNIVGKLVDAAMK